MQFAATVGWLFKKGVQQDTGFNIILGLLKQAFNQTNTSIQNQEKNLLLEKTLKQGVKLL